MGKKKLIMKTKELSLAIAESSTVIGEVQVEQQQVQQITPRKRGRPRKIVEKSEEDDEAVKYQDLQEEMESKKAKSKEEKSHEELVKEEAKEAFSPPTSANKDQPRRSRRKSKPRKSC